MKIFMNGGRTVELSKVEILKRAKEVLFHYDQWYKKGLPTVYSRKTSDGCEETFHSPRGLSSIGSNLTAKEIAAFLRKEIGCKAWVYRTHDEISGDSCTVLVGPFEKIDWNKPIGKRLIHKYTPAEKRNGGKILPKPTK